MPDSSPRLKALSSPAKTAETDLLSLSIPQVLIKVALPAMLSFLLNILRLIIVES